MQPTSSLTVASPDDPLAEAFRKLTGQDLEQLPVLEDGKIVGMLRRRDIARWLEQAWQPTSPEGSRPPSGAAVLMTKPR
jgi:predicted transcriptional regulator